MFLTIICFVQKCVFPFSPSSPVNSVMSQMAQRFTEFSVNTSSQMFVCSQMPIFLSVNRRLNMMFSYFELCALISGDSFKRLATDKQNQSKFFKSVVLRAGFHIC